MGRVFNEPMADRGRTRGGSLSPQGALQAIPTGRAAARPQRYSMIEQVADDNGVFFLDNDSKLGGRKEYFIDYVHYTPMGVRALATNYSDFIIENNIIGSQESH